MKLRTAITLSTLVAVLALASCKKSEAPVAPAPPATTPAAAPTPAPAPPPIAAGVTVSAIDLATGIDANQRAIAAQTVFAPTDAIYAVVSTSGSAQNVELSAKWTYQDGQTVGESSQSIAPTGPAATAFQIAKPDGFPVGKYKVEIKKDGSSAGTRDFEVK